MNTTVEKGWLLEHVNDPTIRIVDCRYSLGSSEEGYNLYLHNHIPGAVYFHLGKDLSRPVSSHGGRHPLPDLEQFKLTLQKAGISSDMTVIAYDGGEGSFASRLWWLLNYAGHEKVYVLNGGFKKWQAADYPVDSKVPAYEESEFDIKVNPEILASYEEVKKLVTDKKTEAILIDSREEKRYLGNEEPIDKMAGHIPGAINKVWTDGYKNGFFKPSHEQEKRFSEIPKDKEIIVYCGSGVTATPNFIALKSAGYKNVKLYAGSWSDWTSYVDNPIATGEE